MMTIMRKMSPADNNHRHYTRYAHNNDNRRCTLIIINHGELPLLIMLNSFLFAYSMLSNGLWIMSTGMTIMPAPAMLVSINKIKILNELRVNYS